MQPGIMKPQFSRLFFEVAVGVGIYFSGLFFV
jgi:hypothetical protein